MRRSSFRSDCITTLHSKIEKTSREVDKTNKQKYSSNLRSNTLASETPRGVYLLIAFNVASSLNASSKLSLFTRLAIVDAFYYCDFTVSLSFQNLNCFYIKSNKI